MYGRFLSVSCFRCLAPPGDEQAMGNAADALAAPPPSSLRQPPAHILGPCRCLGPAAPALGLGARGARPGPPRGLRGAAGRILRPEAGWVAGPGGPGGAGATEGQEDNALCGDR